MPERSFYESFASALKSRSGTYNVQKAWLHKDMRKIVGENFAHLRSEKGMNQAKAPHFSRACSLDEPKSTPLVEVFEK